MQKSAKDNSGDKIELKNADGSFRRDTHGHRIIDHDLFNHEGLTEDGIAEAFVEFAKKEGLSFVPKSKDLTGFKNLSGLTTAPFDEGKYRALLERLEVAKVLLSKVFEDNLSQRIDSEYFKKRFLQEDDQRKHYLNISIGKLAFVTDGQHGYHEVDEDSNIYHLTAKNAKNWFADIIGADKIAKWVDDNNQRSSLKEKDVILSIRGSVGYCALVVPEVLPANIDQDIAKIALFNEENVNAEYLLTYINSDFGQDWAIRNSSGMVQQGLPLNKVRDFPIPILSKEFQNKIKETIQNAFLTKGKLKTTLHPSRKPAT